MSDLIVGEEVPGFVLPVDGGGTLDLSEFRGQLLVLFFYPKDDTPGCTRESCEFRDVREEFQGLGVQVIGVSKDSVVKHDKFKAKHDLNFPLVSDEDGDVCERYGVWAEKSMYGRTYMGIVRSTFLIDKDGVLVRIWKKVKVPGHVDEVRDAVQELFAA